MYKTKRHNTAVGFPTRIDFMQSFYISNYESNKALVNAGHSQLNSSNKPYLYTTCSTPNSQRLNLIHTALESALFNDEISVVLQPKISAQNEQIIGFETLARWYHPTLGNISPSEFIPIAEHTGLIDSIGLFVFDQSCKYCRELINLGYSNLKFSINVSKIQTQNLGIINDFMSILYKYDLDPACIELEITENIFGNILNKDIAIFQQFKNLGFSLALDDFGTGSSSLEYLRCLPVDTLKIDKSFIDDIGINLTAHPIIQCLINMSHQLKMVVVAEGVETFSQVIFLKNLNCDIFQGYFYSKPVHFNDVLTML